MNALHTIVLLLLLCVLAVAAYADRIHFEMGKFLARQYAENIEAWERLIEQHVKLGRESAAMSASILRQVAMIAVVVTVVLGHSGHPWAEIWRDVVELFFVLVVFDRLIPELLFVRTKGEWVGKARWLLIGLLHLVLPVTLAVELVLSIVGLANPEEEEAERPSEAVDALIEAGETEGVLDEEDRELVRSVVEFGDKLVREVMTPRPEIFAVPASMSLEELTAEVNAHNFSRMPVFAGSLDEVTGIVFARDLLGVKDSDAARKTVRDIEREALFVPETKKVNELLREMQQGKQHMIVVVDEYGDTAGIVTIEDLLEAIVGEIEDEHDEEPENEPVAEADGSFVVTGGFEVSRLRDLLEPRAEAAATEEAEAETDPEAVLPTLLETYEATSVGGLVSEIAGHIPLPGEVVEDGPLRMEVIASTDRRVERVRVSLRPPEAA